LVPYIFGVISLVFVWAYVGIAQIAHELHVKYDRRLRFAMPIPLEN
jgi:hypothetical protein